MSRIVIIDYGSGNLRSAAKAFERAAGKTGDSIIVSAAPEAIAQATHIVLPGVGAFADCMRGLVAIEGMRETLTREVMENRKPFLGICVGMQMLFEKGTEHGMHAGLGWLKGDVVKIPADSGRSSAATTPRSEGVSVSEGGNECASFALKIPHMGWNTLTLRTANHPLLAGITDGDHAYFVHSYHARCATADDVLATTDYGSALTAVVARGNIMGTQFHPEKSQQTGLRLIENFLTMR